MSIVKLLKSKDAISVISLAGMALVLTACIGVSPRPEPQSTKLPSITAQTGLIETVTTITVNIPTPTVVPTTYFAPAASLSPTPDNRLKPYYWRDWPVSPDLSPNAQEILSKAINNPALDLHTFSKVGDCQMTPSTFIAGFANGEYEIPAGRSAVVTWFSTSMTSDSVTAANGLGISSVLNPMFGLAAGNTQCQPNETPLDC